MNMQDYLIRKYVILIYHYTPKDMMWCALLAYSDLGSIILQYYGH
jgi:hypothetical protein